MGDRGRTSVGGDAGATEGAAPLRIHKVAELTGVPEPTLRAWERRYGVPVPQRTAAGYRLYGPREIDEIFRMRRLCDGGVSPSEAARTIRSSNIGVAPAKRRSSGRAKRETPGVSSSPDGFAAPIGVILRCVQTLDDAGLEAEVRRLHHLAPPVVVLDRIIQPVMTQIGALWHEGAMSVAHEHLASQKVGLFLRDMIRLTTRADATETVLLACFADEDHEVGPLAFALRLAAWGLRPIFMGAKTPPSALRIAVEAMVPRMVGLSLSNFTNRAQVRELLDGYATACRGVPWMVGGRAVDGVADLVRAKGGLVAPSNPIELEAVAMRALRSKKPLRRNA